MSDAIELDPFEDNSDILESDFTNINTSINNNIVNNTTNKMNMNGFNGMGMGMASPYMLQQMISSQFTTMITESISGYSTGNDFIDKFFMALVMIGANGILFGLIGIITNYITSGTNISGNVSNIYSKLYTIFDNYRMKKMKLRTVEISSYDEQRNTNHLYKPVIWYLSNNKKLNYNNERSLYYTTDIEIIDNSSMYNTNSNLPVNININKILPKSISKDIHYKGYIISFEFTKETITVFTDRERKRENHKIILKTTVELENNHDILEDFCSSCISEYRLNLKTKKWDQQIYSHKENEWKGVPSNNVRKLDTIVLKTGMKEIIKKDIQDFIDDEEWYSNNDVPYTRGYLFYGPPGTGKSSMIKALSLYCKRHIHNILLSEIKSDSQLFELLKGINYKETVLVFEDIDIASSIVHEEFVEKKDSSAELLNKLIDKIDDKSEKKKEIIQGPSTLTRSGLLQALDGIFTSTGRIVIMTSNKPNVLAKNLLRSGRIDVEYNFDNCDKSQIINLYKLFFNKVITENDINFDPSIYSPADISRTFLKYKTDPLSALKNLENGNIDKHKF